MRKYFGTDGIRRIANTELTPDLVFRVAKAGAYVLSKHSDHAPTILIGRDTRVSGTLIESAMTAGFLSYGANVKLLGVIPTPAVAYLTRKFNADASVVISASHNTFEFNGVKYFSNKGMKIPDEIEEEIEEIMDSDTLSSLNAVGDKIGVSENDENMIDEYAKFFTDLFGDTFKLSKIKVGIDTANGATYKIADKIFTSLDIDHVLICNEPDGVNINEGCGSTHLERISKFVVDNKLDLGFAYDGDGDRCLVVDDKGEVIDGDIIMAIVATYLKSKGMLANDTIVATVMSNLGLKKFAEANGFNLITTKVGDRYVLENMLANEYNFGGEQSGHIIMLDYNPTGDGILTSLMLLKALLSRKEKLSEAKKIITIYPQVLINAKVSSEKKYDYEKDEEISNAILELEREFQDNGRVLIRPSGTEPKVRVMIEGQDIEYITKRANELAQLIEKKLK
ncbi:MAG: phosphoglucosamine mutase [Clostridia bacterium]|nr:phosphoglucosamine mutase [Clostridia bacterium]